MKISFATIDDVKVTSKEKGVVDIYWENEDGEFGHIYLYSYKGDVTIDSENMGEAFVKKIFEALVENASWKF